MRSQAIGQKAVTNAMPIMNASTRSAIKNLFKSIRRDTLEEVNLKAFSSNCVRTQSLVKAMGKMFCSIWDAQHETAAHKRTSQKQALAAYQEPKMSKLTDRLIETDNATTIEAYEKELRSLQNEKALLEENLTKPTVKHTPASIRNFEPR